MAALTPRTSQSERATRETSVTLALSIDGTGTIDIATGIGFYDHLLTALAFHARFDLELRCVGDLEVDDHHTVEDVALALGSALDAALGDRAGIVRFGNSHAPLDESLARAVVDCSGRPFARVDLGLTRDTIGTMATENIGHALASLATAARLTLHVDVLTGTNDHHRAEAAFKAVALALREAVARSAGGSIPSTKGVLT
jgi:imidazoleglycerol phosphate dehydratase HisB